MTQYQPMPYGNPPAPKQSNAWKIVFAVIGGIMLLTACCCGGIGLWAFTLPEGGVRTANNMESYATDYINDKGLLKPGESIVAYYDVTVNGSSKEAAILTDQRLLYHSPNGDTEIPLGEIVDINHRDEGGLIGDIIEVQGENGHFMVIEIAPYNDGPLFYNALEAQAQLHGYDPNSNNSQSRP